MRKDRMGWVFDRVFPRLQPSVSAQEQEKDDKELNDCRNRAEALDIDDLEKSIASIEVLVEGEDDRRKGIDTRLSTIVGLGSIAGSIVIGATLAQPATLAGHGLAMRFLLGVLIFYITLQLCLAVFWAIRGLNRRNYSALTPGDFLPDLEIPIRRRLRDRLATLVELLQHNRSTNNEKMGAMAVAHQASQNFIVGLGCLSLVGVVMFLIGPSGTAAAVGQSRGPAGSPPMVQAPVRHVPIPAGSGPAIAPGQPRSGTSVPVAAPSPVSKKR